MGNEQSTLWTKLDPGAQRRMYGSTIVGQVLLAAIFLATGMVDFTIGNVIIMAFIGWTSFMAIRFVMNSFVVTDTSPDS